VRIHTRELTVAVALALTCSAAVAEAQDPRATTARPVAVIEGALGWAGFVDESVVHHTLLGGGARYYLSRRISIGPEVQFMTGPGEDRDLVLTGNLVIDALGATAARPRRTTPYLVLGGGLFRHSDRFGRQTFASTEGAFTFGPGMRVWLSDRAFVAGDVRIGWEAHLRLAAVVGVALK
jgi:hypothetical protein